MSFQEPIQTSLEQSAPAIRLEGGVKRYGSMIALQDVDFSVRPGEVRALLGKNGAGKSTLVRILSGSTLPDQGRVIVAGKTVIFSSPGEARRMGVATVHQELSIVPHLTVAENVFLGRWNKVAGQAGFLNRRRLEDRAAEVLSGLGLSIRPSALASTLSVAQRQIVEIARALSEKPKVLILDEPTSSLPPAEVSRLLEIINRLSAEGLAVVYVSHRMDEIPRIAHSVTVLRDGRHIETAPLSEMPIGRVIELMTGTIESQHAAIKSIDRSAEPVVVAFSNVTTGKLRSMSFELRQGEVLGLAGLLGSGRTEVLQAAFGIDRPQSGQVLVFGEPVDGHSPRHMIARGVGLAPEERKRDGLVLNMSISTNIALSSLEAVSRNGFLDNVRQFAMARKWIDRLRIKAADADAAVRSLSGGNQQKVVLGKCLGAGVRVLLLDEPTRGVDVEAKAQIYSLLRSLSEEGISIIVASSEIEELFFMCDRLLILSHGEKIAERRIDQTTLVETMKIAMEGIAA